MEEGSSFGTQLQFARLAGQPFFAVFHTERATTPFRRNWTRYIVATTLAAYAIPFLRRTPTAVSLGCPSLFKAEAGNALAPHVR